MTDKEHNVYAPIWQTQEPNFIGNDGIKWWIHKALTKHAKNPNENGTILDYQVFIVEHPNKLITGVILDEKRQPIFENQETCALYDKINIMKIVKEGNMTDKPKQCLGGIAFINSNGDYTFRNGAGKDFINPLEGREFKKSPEEFTNESEEVPADDGWLSIENAPKDGSSVLFYHMDGFQLVGAIHDGIMVCAWNNKPLSDSITHWRHLPNPPREKFNP